MMRLEVTKVIILSVTGYLSGHFDKTELKSTFVFSSVCDCTDFEPMIFASYFFHSPNLSIFIISAVQTAVMTICITIIEDTDKLIKAGMLY